MTSPEKKSFLDFANNPPFKFENSKTLETLVSFFKKQHVKHNIVPFKKNQKEETLWHSANSTISILDTI